jgi:histidine triad (HIT) family protein
MSDCVFCGIVAGEVPASVVHTTDRVIAFRDIAPAAPTHIVVVTRQHFDTIGALAAADPELAGELAAVAAEVATAQGIGAGWRLVFNSGADAGQTVFHVHGHVLGGRPFGRLV